MRSCFFSLIIHYSSLIFRTHRLNELDKSKIGRFYNFQTLKQKFRFHPINCTLIRQNLKNMANPPADLNFDKLDLNIIQQLMHDANISYAEIGKKLFVSAGTIHVRIKKLQEAGVISGMKYNVDLKKLGYDVIAFVGIYLEKSSLYDAVAKDLKKIPEIVRMNYTTGNYSIFAEVVCKDIGQLRSILHDELQKIKGIERTETFISLEESLNRTVTITPA